jgi:predicted CXXCH cytochrome family protein
MKKLYVALLAAGIVGIAASVNAAGLPGQTYTYTAGDGIAVSPHNMNNTFAGVDGDNQGLQRICVYCHTPHFARKPGGLLTYSPLWNRDTPSLSYAMYNNGDNPVETDSWKDGEDTGIEDPFNPGTNIMITEGLANHNSYASAMGAGTGANQPAGVSLMCLSCHDGSIAINAYGQSPSSSYNAGDDAHKMDPNTKYFIGGTNTTSGGNGDLSNHHPVGFSYLTAYNRDDELAPITDAIGNMNIGDLLSSNGNMECNTCHDVHNTKNEGAKLVWADNTQSAFCLACHLK